MGGFPESLTFRPSFWRRLGRALVEGLRIVLPLALIIATGYLIIVLIMPLAADNGWGMQVANALALAGFLYRGGFIFICGGAEMDFGGTIPSASSADVDAICVDQRGGDEPL